MKKLSLEGMWKLRAEFLDVSADRWQEVLNRGDGPFNILHEKSPNVFPLRHGFIDAVVPCDVITPLVENGILEEPFIGTNTDKCLWIRDLSWWFTREFEVDEELLSQEEIRLFIEMLDFKADIIINGIPAAQHRNTFVPFHEDVKKYLKTGTNRIIIRLTSGIEDYYSKDSVSFYCASGNAICDQRIYLRKPQFTYGWDWCRPVPTCGIGRAIYLEGITGAKITAFRADTLKCNKENAELDLFFEIDNVRMQSADDAELEYQILYDGNPVAQGRKELYLCGGLNFIHEAVSIQSPSLWWPNGYGEQSLYTVTAHVVCRGADNVMENNRIGIRTIEVRHDKLPDGTREYKFVVNGVKVWCKGGNWVPTDSVYLRTPSESYKKLVDEAKAANFTMLRMWGGGTYEPDYFYEYCSENGILLMHDFMYACGYYPDHLEWFLHQAELEADYQTKRLAHYPCIAIWTGNNEIHESYTDWFPGEIHPDKFYGAKIFNYVQPTAVKKNAPMTAYAPSTPFFGEHANDQDSGDSHVWKWLSRFDETKMKYSYELEAFDRLKTRFSSEYGFHGALMRSSIERYHNGAPIERDGQIWNHHGESERKHIGIYGGIQRHLTQFSELDNDGYLLYSGILQGCLYADMAETLRSKSFCSGNLIWMYNDCWPETGWTVIDYYLTRKVSFYYLKRAYAACKLIMKILDGKAVVTVINETPENISLNLEYGYMTFSGETKEKYTVSCDAAGHSWQQPLNFSADGDLTEGFYYIKAGDDRFAPVSSVRAYYRQLNLPAAKAEIIKTEIDGDDLLVTVRAENFIPAVYLQCRDDRTHLSDNYFTMMPGDEKVVRVEICTEIPVLKCAEMIHE